jgi:two-component system nitrate/nitrite response regulator NarL
LLIRLFLISNFRLLLEGLVAVVASRPERFTLVGSAASLEEAGSTLVTTAAQLVLLDVDGSQGHLPFMIEEIKAQCGAKILLLTGQDDGSLPDRTAALGACGVIDRLTTPELLLRALEKVHEGELWLNRVITGRLVNKNFQQVTEDSLSTMLALLTDRERKVLTAVVHHGGESGKVIAQRLHIGESTLRNHLTSIYGKLNVPNRNGLLAYAMEAGLTERLPYQTN